MMKISTLVKTICLSVAFWVAFSFCAQASCLSLSECMEQGIGDNFILKEAYEIIAEAMVIVSKTSWLLFAKSLQAVVGLGTAIYIAMYTLRNVGSFSQQDTAAYLSNEKTGVIPIAVKMLIIVWLLGNQSFIYKYLISLAVTTCIEIGTIIGSRSGIGTISSPDNLADLFAFVINKVIDFNNSIYHIVATGQLLFRMSFVGGILNIYWKTAMFAIPLWIYGWIIIIGISFYMLDVLFRLGIGCVVLPFAIACGLSKFTIDYTRKTWNLFMNVGFNFIMLGILIGFANEMINKCVGLEIPENKKLNEADIKYINDQLDLGVFVTIALCCMITFKLFMQIEQIVDKISGTSSVGKVGQETGAKLGKLAKRAATKPSREAGKFVGAGAQVAGNKVSRSVNRIRRYVSNKIKNSAPYQAVSNSRVGRTYRATKKFLRWNER